MQNVTNFFIANLAFADILIGMFTTPFEVSYIFKIGSVRPNVNVDDISVLQYVIGNRMSILSQLTNKPHLKKNQ